MNVTIMNVSMITLNPDGSTDVRTRSGRLLGSVVMVSGQEWFATRFVDQYGKTHPHGYQTDGALVDDEAAGVHWIASRR